MLYRISFILFIPSPLSKRFFLSSTFLKSLPVCTSSNDFPTNKLNGNSYALLTQKSSKSFPSSLCISPPEPRFFYFLATPRSTLSHWRGGSFTYQMLMTALFLQHKGDREPRNDVGFKSSIPLSSDLIFDGHNRTKKMTYIHKNVSHKV